MGVLAVNQRSLARAHDLLRRNAEDSGRPFDFRMLGLEWTLLPDVFSPVQTPVTELFTQWIDYPAGGTFLEIGCGAGVTAVIAALSGCRSVTAVDIMAASLENTRRNAQRHGVGDRVQVVLSDMLDSLDASERFDVVFWNSNFVEAPSDFVNSTALHHALFDPGYRAHRKFLGQAPRHLTPSGRLLLGFSDLGNRQLLDRLAAEVGLVVTSLVTEKRALEIPLEFQLLELTPAGGRQAWPWS